MRPSQWRGDLALAAIALVWGSTFVLVKSALDDVSTMLFLAIRFSLATLALLLIHFIRRRSWRMGRFGAGAAVGAFLYIGYLLQTLGLRFTTPAKSGFITGMYIVVVPLLSAAVYKKIPGVWEWSGVLLASAGLALLTLDSASLSMGTGDILTVGCAIAFAVHILLVGHYSRQIPADWFALLQVGASAIFAVGTFWVLEQPFVKWSMPVISALLITSILATAGAFWVQTWAQQYTTATRAALVFAMEPVFAWFTSFLVTGERLTSQAVAGAVCILLGIMLVELKPTASRNHQPT
jgi:drug/metabolite transporter (DMT)-like permease